MAYLTGDVILDDHYNLFATGTTSGTADNNVANINTVWNTGFGDRGYGQTSPLAAVTVGGVVTATQWGTLITRINSIISHQQGAVAALNSGLTAPTVGTTINYLADLSTRVTQVYDNRFLKFADGATASSNFGITWLSDNPESAQITFTLSFLSGDSARYFFNAGGSLTVVPSISAGAGTTKELSWSDLLAAVGGLRMSSLATTRSGTGETLVTDGLAIGYWDLTTSDQTIIKLADATATYSTNYVEVLARTNGPQGVNGDNGTIITFTVNFVDADPEQYGSGGELNMTLNVAAGYIAPSTTYLSASWANPTATEISSSFPSYINVIGFTANSGGLSPVMTLPAGIVQNDLVILAASGDDADTYTVPSGYTTIYNDSAYSTGRVVLCYKFMGSTPDTTVTGGAVTGATHFAAVFRNVSTITPFSTDNQSFLDIIFGGASQPQPMPQITTTISNSLVLSVVHYNDLDTIALAPADFNKIGQANTTSGTDSTTSMAIKFVPNAGTTVGNAATFWENNDSAASVFLSDVIYNVALTPAGLEPTFRYISQSAAVSTTLDSIVVTAPTGILNGDILVAFAWQNDSATTQPTYPSGFTEQTFNQYGWLATKTANNESGNYTFGWLGTATTSTVVILVYRGPTTVISGGWATVATAATTRPNNITGNAGILVQVYVAQNTQTGNFFSDYPPRAFLRGLYGANPVTYIFDELNWAGGTTNFANLTYIGGAIQRSSIAFNLY